MRRLSAALTIRPGNGERVERRATALRDAENRPQTDCPNHRVNVSIAGIRAPTDLREVPSGAPRVILATRTIVTSPSRGTKKTVIFLTLLGVFRRRTLCPRGQRSSSATSLRAALTSPRDTRHAARSLRSTQLIGPAVSQGKRNMALRPLAVVGVERPPPRGGSATSEYGAPRSRRA